MVAFLVALAIAIGLGAAAYNAGVQAGLAEAVRIGTISPDAAPVIIGGWWHGGFWGPGFGPFGFFFGLLAIFLVFGLLRAALFGGGRHHGPRGWGGGGSGSGWGDRQDRMAELHRELHRRDADRSQPSAGA